MESSELTTLDYVWFRKVLRKKSIKENDFIIFDFIIKNIKSNQI